MLTEPAQRVKAALAEAGYPDADVAEYDDGKVGVTLSDNCGHEFIPEYVAWKAFSVTGLTDMDFEYWHRGHHG